MAFLGEKFLLKYDGAAFLLIAAGVSQVTLCSNQEAVVYSDAYLH